MNDRMALRWSIEWLERVDNHLINLKFIFSYRINTVDAIDNQPPRWSHPMKTFKTLSLALLPAAITLGIVAHRRRSAVGPAADRAGLQRGRRELPRQCRAGGRQDGCGSARHRLHACRCAAHCRDGAGQQEDAEDRLHQPGRSRLLLRHRGDQAVLPRREGRDHGPHAEEDRGDARDQAAGLGPAHGRQRTEERAAARGAEQATRSRSKTRPSRSVGWTTACRTAATCGSPRSRRSPAA